MSKLRPDVIHTYFIDSALLGVIFGKILGVRCIITSRRDLGFWYTKKTIFLMKIINKLTDRIIVNSNAIKDHVKQTEHIRDENVEVIHNGIEKIYDDNEIEYYRVLHRNKLDIDMQTNVVGIVSNLNRDVKRVDVFVNAAVKYLQRDKDVVFLVVGEGHLKEKMMKIVDAEGANEKVRFLGSINNAIEVICAFDVAVNTSESEGFSNSVIESMAHRVCTIASDNPGNKELIENNRTGILYPVNDVDALVERMLYITKNEKVRLKIAESAREEVISNYSLGKMVSSHEQLYVDIHGNNNSLK
jgi:glycosyltransferase involved in cell wall biosynthesis